MAKRILIHYPYVAPHIVGRSKGGTGIWWGFYDERDEYDAVVDTGTVQDSGSPILRGAVKLVLEPPSVAPMLYSADWRLAHSKVITYGPPWTPNTIRLDRCPWPFDWPELPEKADTSIPWCKRSDVVGVMGNKLAQPYCGAGCYEWPSLYVFRRDVADYLHKSGRYVCVYGTPRFPDRWCHGEIPGRPKELKRKEMSEFGFAICFENTAMRGYVTEKLPDALAAGCVPLYRVEDDWVSEFVPRSIRTFRDALRLVEEFTEDDYQRFVERIDLNAFQRMLSPQPLFDLLEEML